MLIHKDWTLYEIIEVKKKTNMSEEKEFNVFDPAAEAKAEAQRKQEEYIEIGRAHV